MHTFLLNGDRGKYASPVIKHLLAEIQSNDAMTSSMANINNTLDVIVYRSVDTLRQGITEPLTESAVIALITIALATILVMYLLHSFSQPHGIGVRSFRARR